MTEQLFDPGPAEDRPKAEGELYVPDKLKGTRYDVGRNERVRAQVKDWVVARVQAGDYEDDAAARNALARKCVDLGLAHNVRTFGEPRQLHHAKGDDARYDAARTNMRQFWMGKDLADWALCVIEGALADHAGAALPPCMYQSQGTIGQAAARNALDAALGDPEAATDAHGRPTATGRPEPMW